MLVDADDLVAVKLGVIAFFAPGTVEKSPEMTENAGKMVFQSYLDTNLRAGLRFTHGTLRCKPRGSAWRPAKIGGFSLMDRQRFSSHFGMNIK